MIDATPEEILWLWLRANSLRVWAISLIGSSWPKANSALCVALHWLSCQSYTFFSSATHFIWCANGKIRFHLGWSEIFNDLSFCCVLCHVGSASAIHTLQPLSRSLYEWYFLFTIFMKDILLTLPPSYSMDSIELKPYSVYRSKRDNIYDHMCTYHVAKDMYLYFFHCIH